MEKLDKNYIIGLVLMFLMYGAYVYFMPKEPTQVQPEKVEVQAPVKPENKISVSDTIINESNEIPQEIKDYVLENDRLKITFSNKGASIKEVIIKNYRTFDTYLKNGAESVKVIGDGNSTINLELLGDAGNLSLLNKFAQTEGAQGNKISFKTPVDGNSFVVQTYELPSEGFLLNYAINLEGNSNYFNKESLNFIWENKLRVLENDLNQNRKGAQINYYDADEEFGEIGFGSTGDSDDELDEPLKWFGFKQNYFNQTIIAKELNFGKPKLSLTTPTEDSTIVKDGKVSVTIPLADLKSNKGKFEFYFGPNDYEIIKDITPGFKNNVYVGYDILKPINRYVFIPLFNWFEKYVFNYGVLIILVVLLIKTVLTPLIYKSYLSSAKMRVLAPQIKEIKDRVGDDAAKVQQETMKLYQQVGVSPLSGCVPMLLQMPILMSVFFLFPNMIMFRQKPFLWAKDLSTYDDILHWGFNIPFIGNHLSLFVVLYAISSIAFTYYNNQNTPKQEGLPFDISKMAYFFPLIFCVVLNSYAVALTFYYFVSNLVTIAQQLVVRRFIDEDRIKLVLEENRRNYQANPKKKNKFTDYLEKQMKASEEMRKESQQQKNKNKNRKKK